MIFRTGCKTIDQIKASLAFGDGALPKTQVTLFGGKGGVGKWGVPKGQQTAMATVICWGQKRSMIQTIPWQFPRHPSSPQQKLKSPSREAIRKLAELRTSMSSAMAVKTAMEGQKARIERDATHVSAEITDGFQTVFKRT